MFMNHLIREGIISIEESSGNLQINLDNFHTSLKNFVFLLGNVSSGDISKTIPVFFNEYEDNRIWDKFKLLPNLF